MKHTESDLDGHFHIDSALLRRVTDAELGNITLTPNEVTRLWCEIQYLSDELRKARNSSRICMMCGKLA